MMLGGPTRGIAGMPLRFGHQGCAHAGFGSHVHGCSTPAACACETADLEATGPWRASGMPCVSVRF